MDSAPRELPQFVHDFAAHLRAISRRVDFDSLMPGATAAERHLHDTGHAMERGCCTKPGNVCAGCRRVLPREAKRRGESYCSRSCREAHAE